MSTGWCSVQTLTCSSSAERLRRPLKYEVIRVLYVACCGPAAWRSARGAGGAQSESPGPAGRVEGQRDAFQRDCVHRRGPAARTTHSMEQVQPCRRAEAAEDATGVYGRSIGSSPVSLGLEGTPSLSHTLRLCQPRCNHAPSLGLHPSVAPVMSMDPASCRACAPSLRGLARGSDSSCRGSRRKPRGQSDASRTCPVSCLLTEAPR